MTGEYTNFGTAGVKVSPIALGMGLRGQGYPEQAERLVNHAIDSGVNLIDCANTYGLGDDRRVSGTSEEVLGRVLKTRRDEVVVTTKVHSPVAEGPNDRGASRYTVMREMDRSLKRLQTDHVDVYLLHSYPTSSPLEETMRVLDDLVTQGKTRYIGVCNFDAWQVMKTLWTQDRLGADPLICVQNRYSLLNRSLESEIFDLVADQGLGIMAYSPLAIGLLSGAYSPDGPLPPHSPWASASFPDAQRDGGLAAALTSHTIAVIETVRRIAFDRGKTMSQVAINWLLSHPEVTVAISGSDTIEQFDDNLGALGWSLTEDEINTLDVVSADVGQVKAWAK